MDQVTLHIENSSERRDYDLEQEVTLGRTDASSLVVSDGGLSRRNTTIFRDGDLVLIVDEGSLNGTFLNGRKLSGPPEELRNGDEVRIGSETTIRVQIGSAQSQRSAVQPPVLQKPAAATPAVPAPRHAASPPGSKRLPLIPIAAGLMTIAIIFFALIAYLVASKYKSTPVANTGRPLPPVSSSSLIPVRVIDPLGGEDEDDLDDLIASWEVPEAEIKAENVADVKVDPTDTADADLNVTAAMLADRQRKALEPRSGETGIRPAGLDVPKELFGDGVIKQKAKLKEMNTKGYQQPMDFADLAAKRMRGDLIEMPMAAKSFYLDVGGSASDGPFSSFAFQTGPGEIAPGSPKYQALSQLAANFSGTKYDLNNPADRKQMRMRLLRMFNKRAKPILEEVADAYFAKFGRPLRVTSLTRSMDYQIGLNSSNPNSFKVRGEGSLPPHTSGCAFDLARKHMTAEEQNFVMQKLAQMEDANKLDALIEYGVNACFHIFIYDDGIPPKL
jgi:pSer/pThr/pTyr-binding forkhead associated (FHA) protein